MAKVIKLILLLALLCACSNNDIADSDKSDNGNGNNTDTNTIIKAPNIKEEDDKMIITFNYVPKCLDDLKEIANFKNPKLTTALFIISLNHYVDDKDEGLKMLNYLCGPRELSDYDKSFIKDCLSDKTYLMNSYFEGSSPKNDYSYTEPLEIILYDDQMQPIEGYTRVFVYSSGADSIRYLQLRAKGDEYYIWEYAGILLSIRIPASLDAWS